jgi:hypothetical protein
MTNGDRIAGHGIRIETEITGKIISQGRIKAVSMEIPDMGTRTIEM